MKTAKTLVLAIVAAGTLMGSIGTGSAVAGPGDPLQGVIISLRGETTGTVKSNGKKRSKKASVSRKRRAKNAERRRQRQLRREYERFLTAMYVVAVEEGDFELAVEALDQLGNDGSGETGGILTLTLNGKIYQEVGPPDYNGPDKTVKMRALFRVPPDN